MAEPIVDALANRNHIVDNMCILRNSGGTALVASAAATAAQTGQSVPFDTGGGHTEGKLIIDVTTCATGATVGPWNIELQGAVGTSFGTPVAILAKLELGGGSQGNDQIPGDRDMLTGRYVIPFSNEIGGKIYRYLRCYTRLGHYYMGSSAASHAPGATGLDYSAFLSI